MYCCQHSDLITLAPQNLTATVPAQANTLLSSGPSAFILTISFQHNSQKDSFKIQIRSCYFSIQNPPVAPQHPLERSQSSTKFWTKAYRLHKVSGDVTPCYLSGLTPSLIYSSHSGFLGYIGWTCSCLRTFALTLFCLECSSYSYPHLSGLFPHVTFLARSSLITILQHFLLLFIPFSYLIFSMALTNLIPILSVYLGCLLVVCLPPLHEMFFSLTLFI